VKKLDRRFAAPVFAVLSSRPSAPQIETRVNRRNGCHEFESSAGTLSNIISGNLDVAMIETSQTAECC
jgi:hypothetical protein